MPNNIIPGVIREFPIADEKLKRSPKSIRGKNNLEPKLTAGTIMLLRDKGAYPLACCIACPVSWAATPMAAMELLEYTLSDNLKTFLDGS